MGRMPTNRAGIYAVPQDTLRGSVYLVDNVLDTGLTMRECMALIPDAMPLPFATVGGGKRCIRSIGGKNA
jgi:hypoxanthine-guanine phosphoribosyltransferase